MKTQTIIELEWRHCYNDDKPNTYEAEAGNLIVLVEGKSYKIFKRQGRELPVIFEAKSRSIKDALTRSSKKALALLLRSEEDVFDAIQNKSVSY